MSDPRAAEKKAADEGRGERSDFSDWFGLAGLSLISGGAGAIYWPAGLIAAGVSFLMRAWGSAQVRKGR